MGYSTRVQVSQTGVGAKVIPSNRFESQTVVQVAVTGTATWTVKFTLANVQRGETPVWADHPDGAVTGTGAGVAVFDFPVMALQLAVSSGTGTATALILQGD